MLYGGHSRGGLPACCCRSPVRQHQAWLWGQRCSTTARYSHTRHKQGPRALSRAGWVGQQESLAADDNRAFSVRTLDQESRSLAVSLEPEDSMVLENPHICLGASLKLHVAGDGRKLRCLFQG